METEIITTSKEEEEHHSSSLKVNYICMLSLEQILYLFCRMATPRDKIVFLIALVADKECREVVNYKMFRDIMFLDIMKEFKWIYSSRFALETQIKFICARLAKLSTCISCGANCDNYTLFSYKTRQMVCHQCIRKEWEKETCKCGKPVVTWNRTAKQFTAKGRCLSIDRIERSKWQHKVVFYFIARCARTTVYGGCGLHKKIGGEYIPPQKSGKGDGKRLMTIDKTCRKRMKFELK